MSILGLDGSPYLTPPESEPNLADRYRDLEKRIELLRTQGVLTPATLKDYYGQQRFEQVAASNALEGSTLSAGETELAILKGVTFTGHDPAYVRDAIALDKALRRLTELAREQSPTDIEQVKELHGLILEGRSEAGLFRREPVRIAGSPHTPPATWQEVMSGMEEWEAWSKSKARLIAPLRATVLHAWLAHIHPFRDGNGRSARAITNLELVRAGYPPILIKKKDRPRYLDGLAEADAGGDLTSFCEFMLDRMEAALIGLERSAQLRQGYAVDIARIQQLQEQRLSIWLTAVKLLALTLENQLEQRLTRVKGSVRVRSFEESLDLEEYLELCQGRSISRSWAFTVEIDIPGVGRETYLAWQGFRSSLLFNGLNRTGGPSLFWSLANPTGSPRWIADESKPPMHRELTLHPDDSSRWLARMEDGSLRDLSASRLVLELTDEFCRPLL